MLELKFWMLDFSQDHRVNDSLEENIGRLQHSYKLNKIATSLQMGKNSLNQKDCTSKILSQVPTYQGRVS